MDPVGQKEIAERAGVKPDTVKKWIARHPGFPKARWTVGGNAAWEWTDVHRWLGERNADNQEDAMDTPTHTARVVGGQLHVRALPAARGYAPAWETRRTIKLTAHTEADRLTEAGILLVGGQYSWVGPWITDGEGVPTLELLHIPTDTKRRGPVVIVDDESYDGQEGLR